MGENLVLNMASRGYTVAVHNRTTSKVDAFLAGRAAGRTIVGARSPEELVSKLARPRRVMLMVQAGQAVDRVIEALVPLLEPGDVLIDGGNSNYQDTTRRTRALRESGILYVGTGVSGGEEGALLGPSIMPGGNPDAWPALEPIFKAIAAKVDDGTPCCDWIGPDGAGHYVKMVHNGIEYGDMQMIAEAYSLLRDVGGIDPAAMSEIFVGWNDGELSSYLVEITAGILARVDDETGRPLVDLILDAAGQKGTGKWTGIDSLMLGAPVTAITEAVFARALSALKEERVAASRVLPGPEPALRGSGDRAAGSSAADVHGADGTAARELDADTVSFADDVRQALYASKICSYAQGFQLLSMASAEYGWRLDLRRHRSHVARRVHHPRRVPRSDQGGLRRKPPSLANLLLAPYFRDDAIAGAQAAWRRVVATAVTARRTGARILQRSGLVRRLPQRAPVRQPAPGPARLLRRPYLRTRRSSSRGEFFHTDWTGRGGETVSTSYNA